MNATLKQYLPILGSVVVVMLTTLAGALTDQRVTMPELVVIVIATLTAVATYVVPNTTQWPWLKIAVAALLSAFNALQGYLTDGLTSNELILVLVAGIGATGVVAGTNRFAPVHADVLASGTRTQSMLGGAYTMQSSTTVAVPTYGTDVSPAGSSKRDERGVFEGNLIWAIVGILLIVALLIWILNAT